MYLWIGAIFDDKAEDEIRNVANNLNKDYGLSTVAFSLPQHISLKISFECDDYNKVIKFIKSQLCNLSSFDVEIANISKIDGSLIWLDIRENETLRKIHNLLNYSLLESFDIPLKSFDGDEFKFHSTLFFDDKINDHHKKLVEDFKLKFSLPKKYQISEICFGVATTLTPGEFAVVDKMTLK